MTQKGVSKGEMGVKGTEKTAPKRENPFESSKREDARLWDKVVGPQPLDRDSKVVLELAARKDKGSLKLKKVGLDTYETTLWRKPYHLVSTYDPMTGPEYKVYEGKAPKTLQTQPIENPFSNWTGGTT